MAKTSDFCQCYYVNKLCPFGSTRISFCISTNLSKLLLCFLIFFFGQICQYLTAHALDDITTGRLGKPL